MNENIFALIESNKKEFTKTETVIAKYFQGKNPALDIRELSNKLAVSTASITRFSKKLGLDNYKEVVFLYNKSKEKKEKPAEATEIVVDRYEEILRRVVNQNNDQTIKEICKLINKCDRIDFWGIGLTSYIGKDFQIKFDMIGKNVKIESDPTTILRLSKYMNEKDLVIVSIGDINDPTLHKAIKEVRRNKGKIVVLTPDKTNPILNIANEKIITPPLSDLGEMGMAFHLIPALMELDIIYENYVDIYIKNN